MSKYLEKKEFDSEFGNFKLYLERVIKIVSENIYEVNQKLKDIEKILKIKWVEKQTNVVQAHYEKEEQF